MKEKSKKKEDELVPIYIQRKMKDDLKAYANINRQKLYGLLELIVADFLKSKNFLG